MVNLVLALTTEWSPPGAEAGVAGLVRDALLAVGADDVALDHDIPGSPSVVASLTGTEPGPILQWHGHLDAIVTPQGEPEVQGDRIVARGACDMKGSIAAMVFAVRALRAAGLPRRGSIIITFHGLHEEGASTPLLRLFERGIAGDAVLIGEGGAGDDLMLGANGLTFWDLSFRLDQEPRHETKRQPHDRSMIPIAARILESLGGYGDELVGAGGSLFIGSMAVGDYYNRVPVSASFSGTRRHSSRENLAGVRRGLEDFAARVAAEHGILSEIAVQPITEAYAVDPATPVMESFRWAHAQVRGGEIVERLSPTVTNAAHFVVDAGIPALGYGPNAESAHSDHESVSIAELLELVEIYALTSAHFLDHAAPREGKVLTAADLMTKLRR